MKLRYPHIVLFLVTFLLFSGQQFGQQAMVIELKDEVHAASSHNVTRGIKAAEKAGADLIILHMDTYGGDVRYADSIRAAVLDTRIPTAVFIDKNAASAGALISLACDSIYMSPGASIGAATVVSGADGKAAPDKYQSYFRSVMRATAEQQGRNPQIAEKMVDQNLELEGISPKGQVITFTTQEALKYDFADGVVNSLEEIPGKMGMENVEIASYSSTTMDKIISFLVHPTTSSILLLLIFGGVFMEMKTPGVGFAGMVALVAMLAFFAPHYIEGLADYWEMILFFIGIVLIALEIFVVPGFGITGISGLLFVVGGLAVSLIGNDGMDFSNIPLRVILRSVTIVLVSLATSILLVIWLVKQFFKGRNAYPFVDTETMDKEKGYSAVSQKILALVGKEGLTVTDLKPSGFIEIDGEKLDAESAEGFIAKGTKIIVERVRSINLIVKKA